MAKRRITETGFTQVTNTICVGLITLTIVSVFAFVAFVEIST